MTDRPTAAGARGEEPATPTRIDDQQSAPAPEEITTGRAAWRSVARSAGVRALVLPVSAVLGVVNTRLIVEHFGTEAYAQYGLLVALGALLPFADLGVSAAIINAVGGSERPGADDHVRRVLVTSIRALVGSAAVLLGLAAIISSLGWWPTLLGDGLLPGTGPFVAAACLSTIAVTLPVAFGQRVLTGLGRNHVTIAMMGLQTPVVLVVLVLLVRFDLGDGSYLPVVPYLVTFALSVAATAVAARLMNPTVRRAIRDVPRLRSVKGARIFDVAWPMLVQMIALPIAMQTDRLVLSHLADPATLARYNLGAQLYLPVWQIATASGAALWPIFARARARDDRGSLSPMSLSAGFGATAILVCGTITLAAPWLTGLASGGAIELPVPLLIAFSVLMVLQATKYPLGMFMTDASGLRYQALMIVMMVPVNLGLSILLAMQYGAIGPVIGSAIGVLVFQVLANAAYVRRVLRKA